MEALQYKQATVSSNSCNISFFILIPQFACYKGISRKERDDGYFSPGITARSGVLIIVEIELPIFPNDSIALTVILYSEFPLKCLAFIVRTGCEVIRSRPRAKSEKYNKREASPQEPSGRYSCKSTI